MKNFTESLYIFACMVIGGFTGPFTCDSDKTDHSGDTDA